MIARRRLVLALGGGALTAPFAALAQRQQIYRVGILAPGSHGASGGLYGAFVQALKDLGYVEGKSIAFESRYADGKLDRLPALADELVKSKVDVLFAPSSPAVRAARPLAGTTPIVFAVVNDPVGRGFVASLARPGGNITGVMSVAPGLSAQRLGMLKEVAPKISHVAIAIAREPSVADQVAAQISEVQQAAKSNGMQAMPIEIRSRNSFGEAADVLQKWHVDSLTCLDSAVNFFSRDALIEFAASIKVPAAYPTGEYVDAGGLMSYGAKSEWNYRHAALFVDRILKGAQPGALAVEAPTKYELVLNRKTAAALGLQFSAAMLKKANRIVG